MQFEDSFFNIIAAASIFILVCISGFLVARICDTVLIIYHHQPIGYTPYKDIKNENCKIQGS